MLGSALLLPAGTAMAQVRDEATENRESRSREAAPLLAWQAGTGASFSTGDYGRADKTEVLSVPISLRVRSGDWSLRLASSYVSITGPASVTDIDDGEGGADGGAAGGSATDTRAGFGDLSLTLAKRFDLAENTRLTGELRAKFPTASEAERLTTGTTDFTLRGRLSQEVGDVSLRVGAQRRFVTLQGTANLRDTWGVSAGASVDLGERIVSGVDIDWTQSAYAGSNAKTSATAFVSLPLSARLRLTGYGATGLSSNAADLTLGFSLSLRID